MTRAGRARPPGATPVVLAALAAAASVRAEVPPPHRLGLAGGFYFNGNSANPRFVADGGLAYTYAPRVWGPSLRMSYARALIATEMDYDAFILSAGVVAHTPGRVGLEAHARFGGAVGTMIKKSEAHTRHTDVGIALDLEAGAFVPVGRFALALLLGTHAVRPHLTGQPGWTTAPGVSLSLTRSF